MYKQAGEIQMVDGEELNLRGRALMRLGEIKGNIGREES